MWDLGSLTGDQTYNPALEGKVLTPLDHQEAPIPSFLDFLPIQVTTEHRGAPCVYRRFS